MALRIMEKYLSYSKVWREDCGWKVGGFNPLQSTCSRVLVQDTEPQIAPEIALFVRING